MKSDNNLLIIIAVVVAAFCFTQGQRPHHDDVNVKTGPPSVLIVEETANRPRLPASQLAVLTSTEIDNWAKANCAKDENGNPEFRVLDKDADVSYMSQKWKDAFNAAKSKQPPHIVISNGKTGTEGDLPKTIPDTLDLLNKWKAKP